MIKATTDGEIACAGLQINLEQPEPRQTKKSNSLESHQHPFCGRVVGPLTWNSVLDQLAKKAGVAVAIETWVSKGFRV